MNVNWQNPTAKQAVEMASALAFAAHVVDMETAYGGLYCPTCGYLKVGDILQSPSGPVYIEACNNCGWVDWDNSRAVLEHDVPGGAA